MAEKNDPTPKLYSMTHNKRVISVHTIMKTKYHNKFKKKKTLARFEVLVPEVLKDHNAFTCRVRQSMKKYKYGYLILLTNAL